MTIPNEPIDTDLVYFLATAPARDEIDIWAAYARLYEDAEATETALREEVAALKADLETARNQTEPASHAALAKELTALTGESVCVEVSTWNSRYTWHNPPEDKTKTEYKIYSSKMNEGFAADTLDEAARKFRDKWQERVDFAAKVEAEAAQPAEDHDLVIEPPSIGPAPITPKTAASQPDPF